MLSTRPEKSVGSDKIWDDATAALRGGENSRKTRSHDHKEQSKLTPPASLAPPTALERKNWDYCIDEGGGGETQ